LDLALTINGSGGSLGNGTRTRMTICKTVINNDCQGAVVLKFMKNKERFQREVDSRKNHTLDLKYVVGITESYSEDEHPVFKTALESNQKRHAAALDSSTRLKDLSEYKYALAMPCADRNLDTIFRSERPDEFNIRDMAKDIADAIAHVHKNGLIHGDVKLLNAVRVGHRLALIDLDASATIGKESFAGAKFSSGMLPPEMIAELTFDENDKYMAYVQTDVNAAIPEKTTPKGVAGSNTLFAVKTFLTQQ
jgi:serine/threonine protein kinase